MTAMLSTVTTVQPSAADVRPDHVIVVNGFVIDVESVTVCALAADLITVVGIVHGMGLRTFRLDVADPVTILG